MIRIQIQIKMTGSHVDRDTVQSMRQKMTITTVFATLSKLGVLVLE